MFSPSDSIDQFSEGRDTRSRPPRSHGGARTPTVGPRVVDLALVVDGEQAAAAYKERRQKFYSAGKPDWSPDSLKNHFYSWSNSKPFLGLKLLPQS